MNTTRRSVIKALAALLPATTLAKPLPEDIDETKAGDIDEYVYDITPGSSIAESLTRVADGVEVKKVNITPQFYVDTLK